MSKRTIAIIGAGPAALYGADKLSKAGHEIIMINRDIKPGGLAEYGIYLNKYKMKSGLRKVFSKILARENVHYFGNVRVGHGEDDALTIEALRALGVDAIVVAVGAQGTKWLGLPGEEAAQVYHAKDLVYHYNHLPPFSEREYPVGQHVAVVGFGNVSLDIVHWLVCEKRVASATIVARRGPAERATTDKELKLISGAMDLEQLRAEVDRVAESLITIGQEPAAEYDSLIAFADEPLEVDSPTAVRARFLHSPAGVRVDEDGQVQALVCDLMRLTAPKEEGGRPGIERTGERSEVPCDAVVFAIGDSIEPSIGLPLEPRWRSTFATVPAPWAANPDRDRYMVYDPETAQPVWGTFVVGWARRASDGLVGKARQDAQIGCDEILAWLDGELEQQPAATPRASEAILNDLTALFAARGVRAVDLDGIATIEAAEAARAEAEGLPEFKFDTSAEMLALLS